MTLSKLWKLIYTPNPDIWNKIKSVRSRRLITVSGWAALILLPAYSLFHVEYIHFANKQLFLNFVSTRSKVLLFDLLVLYLIYLLILFVFKRGWIAALACGFFSCGAAFADYFKFRITGDYFYPWDIVQTKNIPILLDYIITPFPLLYWLMTAFTVFTVLFIAFSRVGIPTKWFVRLPLAIVLLLSIALPVRTPESVTALLNNNDLFLEDMALQKSNYESNGFMGATIVNILSGNIAKPENYSRETIDSLLGKYSYTAADEDFNSPDIILILSESYWDPKLLGSTEFSFDPIENFSLISQRDNCYTGTFYTTAFGGGTIRPEFEVITGLTSDYLPGGCVPYQYLKDGFHSYLTQYKESGYKAIAVHPYLSSFYMRNTALRYLGFDELYFSEQLEKIESVEINYRGKQISDDTFVEYIKYFLDGSYTDDESPRFIFGISMENHQPYADKFDDFGITVTNPNMDEETLMLVQNYTQGVVNADRALMKLADYIASRERDTVLVYYGDHAPSLGINYAAYAQSGMVNDTSSLTHSERMLMQGTPFMIYSNFELKQSGMFASKTDNQIASYNLLNALSTLIGSPRTPVMDFLRDYYFTVPNYNIRLALDINADMSYYINGHNMLTYDRIKGNKYSIMR